MTCGTWVIGGGTGIGKATAFRLARDGYRVAVRGRREEQLTETVREIVEADGSARAIPGVITGDDAVVTHDAREKESLEVLVRPAGPNMPNRSWSPLTTTDFPRVSDPAYSVSKKALSSLTALPPNACVGELR